MNIEINSLSTFIDCKCFRDCKNLCVVREHEPSLQRWRGNGSLLKCRFLDIRFDSFALLNTTDYIGEAKEVETGHPLARRRSSHVIDSRWTMRLHDRHLTDLLPFHRSHPLCRYNIIVSCEWDCISCNVWHYSFMK